MTAKKGAPKTAAKKSTSSNAAKKSTSAGATKKASVDAVTASDKIAKRVDELGDWRGEMLAYVRKLIQSANPDIVEEWKWAKATSPGVPVWSHNGIICTGETYKAAVKLTFAKGASVDDPKGLFNSSLEGNMRRAIDIHEGENINETAFKALIRAAIAVNVGATAKRATVKK